MPLDRSFAEVVVAAVRESAAELEPWMPWAKPDYTLADAEAWLSGVEAGRAAGTVYEFAIVDDAGTFLGAAGINQGRLAEGVANLGYWVRSPEAGRGIAPRAVRLVVDWVFEHTALNRLEVLAAVANLRSRRVAVKSGAAFEAVLRKRFILGGVPVDVALYAFVRPD
ncbi:MAG TPA: GNAT family N-acetyltransferase [Polyangiaceae bacterium]|nr:GNAT family N-acetyltransferase [Polyangiaceae bacterium]